MKVQSVVQQGVSDLDAALPGKVTVRTAGGDSSGSPPICILSWNTTRLSENGANPLGKIIRDDVTGEATGREFHRYKQMEFDVTIKAYDEGERDVWLSDVEDAFLPYEYDPSRFHADTTEWEVGEGSPREIAAVEPDWYTGGLTIRFRFVSRVTESADTLTGVQDGENGGVYVDETLDE